MKLIMKLIGDCDGERVFEDSPRFLKINLVVSKIARRLVIVPLK